MASGPTTLANYFAPLGAVEGRKNNKKRRTKSPNKETEFPELIQKITLPDEEPKFITINSDTVGKSLKEMNAFKVKAGIDDISKNYKKASFLNDGSLLLLCNNMNTANKFLNKKTLLGCIPIRVNMHNSLNKTKGLIYSPSLINITEAEIVEGLKDQGVIEAYQYKKREDRTKPSGLVCLAFDKFKLPKKISVGFEIIEVREYIPNPMRCRKCQQIGHTQKVCKSEVEICPKCAIPLPHNTQEAIDIHNTTTFCVNCKSNTHTSDHNLCPKFQIEKNILKLQTINKISRFEARKMYYTTQPQTCNIDPKITFAQTITPNLLQSTQITPTITTSSQATNNQTQQKINPTITTTKPQQSNQANPPNITSTPATPKQKSITQPPKNSQKSPSKNKPTSQTLNNTTDTTEMTNTHETPLDSQTPNKTNTSQTSNQTKQAKNTQIYTFEYTHMDTN